MSATVPIEAHRLEILNSMTDAGRKLAKEIAAERASTASNIVLHQYDTGARLAKAIADEATYGSKFVEQLAEFLGFGEEGANGLYNMRNFAEAFPRDYVVKYSKQPMSTGGLMTVSHWMSLMRLEGNKNRDRWIKRIMNEGLTAKSLQQAIDGDKTSRRAGHAVGRKPSVPSSPLAALQKTYSFAYQFVRLEPELEDKVFDRIDELSPDKVNDQLLAKLTETRDQVAQMHKASEKALKRIDANIVRCKRISKHSGNGHAEADEVVPVRGLGKKGKKGKLNLRRKKGFKPGSKAKKTKRTPVTA